MRGGGNKVHLFVPEVLDRLPSGEISLSAKFDWVQVCGRIHLSDNNWMLLQPGSFMYVHEPSQGLNLRWCEMLVYMGQVWDSSEHRITCSLFKFCGYLLCMCMDVVCSKLLLHW